MKKRWVGINILVVEDDKALLDVLCDYFKISGATIFKASDGQQALQIVETERIDFVLSDVQMPVMDGIELLKKIRIKNPDIPIVLLATGQSQLTEESALGLGASGLIQKPFKLNEITERISQLLETVKAS